MTLVTKPKNSTIEKNAANWKATSGENRKNVGDQRGQTCVESMTPKKPGDDYPGWTDKRGGADQGKKKKKPGAFC